MSVPDSGLDRLGRAVKALLESGDITDGGAALLSAHADLRDLLEPMLAPAQSDPGERDGRYIDDFEIVRELGRGGMGVVYEARQLSLGRRVALKVLDAHLTLSAESIGRFRREAQTASKLDHSGIVKVLTVGSAEGHHYFAMELIDGAPLDRILDGVRASAERPTHQRIETMVDIVAQVADALDHAHRAGVLHRDVKPSNILVRKDGSAVLTDFGLAREMALPSLTQPGAVGGTPHYMSPEQALGRSVDVRSDVFSLGVALFECLTLQRPFAGDTSNEIVQRILREEPVSPARLNPAIAPDLAAIVAKALEKERERRYTGAGAFAADLRAFRANLPVSARPISRPQRLRRWARREPWKAALAAVLVVAVPAVAGAAGYLVARRTEIAVGRQQLREQELETALENGFAALRSGTPARAVPWFERVLRDHPGHPEALAGLVFLVHWQRPGDALAILDREPAALAAHPGLTLLRAGCLRQLGRTDEAAALEAGAPPLTTAVDLFLAGRAEFERGELRHAGARQRAIEHLSLALRIAPAPRRLYYQAWAAAVAAGGDAATRRECAAALALRWPDNPSIWISIASVLRAIEPERAREWLRREPEPAQVTSAFYMSRGVAWNALGDHAAAIADFERVLASEPDNALACYNLGVALGNHGETAAEEAALRRCLQLNPRHDSAAYNLGIILHDSKRFAEAADWYRRSLEVEPRFPDGWCNLGILLEESGDRTEAIAALRRALAIEPQHGNAHAHLCRCFLAMGDHAARCAELERWARLRGDDLDAQLQLVEALIDEDPSAVRDPAKAVLLAERTLPNAGARTWWALSWLARAQAAAGKPVLAISSMETALQLLPADTPDAQRQELQSRLSTWRNAAR